MNTVPDRLLADLVRALQRTHRRLTEVAESKAVLRFPDALTAVYDCELLVANAAELARDLRAALERRPTVDAPPPAPDDLIDLTDVAAVVGVKPETIGAYAKTYRGGPNPFPLPVRGTGSLAKSWWSKAEVVAWNRARGRGQRRIWPAEHRRNVRRIDERRAMREERGALVREMYEAGWTMRAIAAELKCSTTTVIKYVHEQAS